MPSSSSVTYLCLSTTPLLLLFLYFIHLSFERPQVIAKQYEFDDDLDVPPLITLDSMLNTFLATLILWANLFVYLRFFVGKRRSLMQRYTSNNDDLPGISHVVGDVHYEHPKCCGKLCNGMNHTDLAYVTYPDSGSGKFVQKKIRTYHAYHREKVTVVLLPGFPMSGQPLADIERDVLCYQSEHAVRNQDKISEVSIVCLLWMTFCVIGAIVILNQMAEVNNEIPAGVEDVEDVASAWRMFWIMTCLVLPTVSILGNVFQWMLYKNWILHGGSIVTQPTKVPPKSIQPEELNNDEEGGFSLL